ncbi:Hypothetical predicted protein, partial [Olea europaea subsp. europaea]
MCSSGATGVTGDEPLTLVALHRARERGIAPCGASGRAASPQVRLDCVHGRPTACRWPAGPAGVGRGLASSGRGGLRAHPTAAASHSLAQATRPSASVGRVSVQVARHCTIAGSGPGSLAHHSGESRRGGCGGLRSASPTTRGLGTRTPALASREGAANLRGHGRVRQECTAKGGPHEPCRHEARPAAV